ncbi:MAG: M48 family metallopeptidase [Candidatus Actinomarinaceae bacterium]|tara:strand:- start:112 stop:1395 length:1284 start_codon:yes stop_codon:yes gene_type:complete
MQEFLASTNFTVIFISLIAIKFLLETYLKIRNLKSIELNKDTIPERFTSVVTEEEYKKSIDYNVDRIRFQIFTALFGAVVLIIFTLGGLFNFLSEVVVSTTSSDVLGAVLLGLLLLIVEQVISIPISIYSTFVIEERHGFNKTTTKTFVTDISKSLLISATISSVIYATVIYIVVNLGDNWWIYAFGAVFTLQAIIFFLYPVLIMPLFNKFEPLDDDEFKKPIEKLLEKIDFKSKGLFVMNASLRSTHGNAFFTGFGKNKRIVFFDTLLKTITPDEMEAILGHELGHYKLGHIKKGLLSSLVFGFIGFYLLSEILQSDNFFLDHGLESLTIYSKFLLFYLVIGSYTFFTKPFTSALSRKREFEADDFSFQYTSGEYMISGLLKLSKDNASNLTPDPLYSSYYYSHPPIAERVQSIEKKLSQIGKKRD